MKNHIKLLIVIVSILIFQSFSGKNPPKEYKNYELKQNEIIQFENGPDSKYETKSGSLSKGSYDGTAFTIKYDNESKISVSGVRGCKGIHQNKISFYLCSGTISRNADTITVVAKTISDKLYLINVNRNGIVDTFSSAIRFELVSKTLKNEYCPTLVTMGAFSEITALPKNTNPELVYKAVHKKNTVGIFTYLLVMDAYGLTKTYPSGDYVLVGGNSMSYTK